jgi:hypothetical protein
MVVAVNLGNILIADADVARVQLATRTTFGQVPNGSGGFRDMTDLEIVERLRLQVCETLERMVVVTEKKAATDAAAALTPIIDIT